MGLGTSEGADQERLVETEHRFYHDMEGTEPLSTTVVSALVELEEDAASSPGLLLHDYINTDVLDSVFAPKLDGTPRKDCQIEITLPGYSVAVSSDGQIVITELDREPSA